MTEINRIAPDLVKAQNRVEMHRAHLDEQLRTLQERIQAGGQALRDMLGTARELSATDQKEPLQNLTVFLLAGFLLGGMIARKYGAPVTATQPEASPTPENPVHGTSGARMPDTNPPHSNAPHPIRKEDLPGAWTR